MNRRDVVLRTGGTALTGLLILPLRERVPPRRIHGEVGRFERAGAASFPKLSAQVSSSVMEANGTKSLP